MKVNFPVLHLNSPQNLYISWGLHPQTPNPADSSNFLASEGYIIGCPNVTIGLCTCWSRHFPTHDSNCSWSSCSYSKGWWICIKPRGFHWLRQWTVIFKNRVRVSSIQHLECLVIKPSNELGYLPSGSGINSVPNTKHLQHIVVVTTWTIALFHLRSNGWNHFDLKTGNGKLSIKSSQFIKSRRQVNSNNRINTRK